MRVLKVTFEIPLVGKQAISNMQEAGKLIAEFVQNLEDAGLKGSSHEETIVTRSGRG